MKNYIFRIDVNRDEYEHFVRHHPYCNLLQSYDWAKVKSNWDHIYTGVQLDGSLCAAGLVLIKRLPLSMTMFYIPKGPLLDYQDKELLTFYFQELKKLARQYHCILIKLDPGIPAREYTLNQTDVPVDSEAMTVIQNLENLHCRHKGFTTYIGQTVQPRFHMGLYPCDLKEHLPKSTWRSIKKAQKKNVEVEEAGVQGLHEFAQIMHMTEIRKQVHLRDEAYFKLLLETYDTAHLFLAYVDPSRKQKMLLEKEKELQERLQNKPGKKTEHDLHQVQEELASIQDVCQKYPQRTAIAGGIMIGYGKEAEMLYAGSNDDFMNFRPQYLLYLTQFEYAFEHGYEFVTMGGVDGDFKDGLSEFKSNFNPTIREYIGEFDLPVRPVLYALAMKALPMAKAILKRKS